MRINTNVSALTAQKNLVGSQRALDSSMAKLSSGLRISRAVMTRQVFRSPTSFAPAPVR